MLKLSLIESDELERTPFFWYQLRGNGKLAAYPAALAFLCPQAHSCSGASWRS